MPVSWLTWCYLKKLWVAIKLELLSHVLLKRHVAAVAKPNSRSSTVRASAIIFPFQVRININWRSGRSPQVGNGNPLQYSCLESFMDREAWWVAVHEVTKSWTWLCSWAGACWFERVIKWKMRRATYEHIWSKTWGNEDPKSKKNRHGVFVLVLTHTEILRAVEEIHETVISCFVSDPMINKLWCNKENFRSFLLLLYLPTPFQCLHSP